MTTLNCEPSYFNEREGFEFGQVRVGEVENVLLSINNDTPPGIDNLDGKLLRMVSDFIAPPI
jgi:hypothetical protein